MKTPHIKSGYCEIIGTNTRFNLILLPLARREIVVRGNPALPILSKHVVCRDNFHFISILNPVLSLFYLFREFGKNNFFSQPFFLSLPPGTFSVPELFSCLKQTLHSSGWHIALNLPDTCFASSFPMPFAFGRWFAARRTRILGHPLK